MYRSASKVPVIKCIQTLMERVESFFSRKDALREIFIVKRPPQRVLKVGHVPPSQSQTGRVRPLGFFFQKRVKIPGPPMWPVSHQGLGPEGPRGFAGVRC